MKPLALAVSGIYNPNFRLVLLIVLMVLNAPSYLISQEEIEVKVFTSDSIPIQLGSDLFWHAAVDKNNHVWFGTNENSIIKYDGANWTHVPIRGIDDHKVRHVISDLDSNIWVTSADLGPSSRSLGGAINFFNVDNPNLNQVFHAGPSNSSVDPEEIVSRLAYGLAVDKSNYIWAAHGTTLANTAYRYGGIGQYKRAGVWEKYTEGLPRITGKFPGDRNVMAVASDGTSAWVSVNRSCYSVPTIPCENPYVAIYDSQGKETQKFTSSTLPPLSDGMTFVRGIIVDKKGNVWLGFSGGGGIARYKKDSKEWIFYNSTNSNFPYGAALNFQAVEEDADGRIWFGTTMGLIMHHNTGEPNSAEDTLKLYTLADGLPSDFITGIAKQDDNIWITSSSGLARVHINQDPIVKIRLIERGAVEEVVKIRLEGSDGSTFPESKVVTTDVKAKSGQREASFISKADLDFNIEKLYLLDGFGRIIGKIDFNFRTAEIEAGRRKHAIVILHNDLVIYQNHPIESNNQGWDYVNKSNSPLLYPVSMLVPPPTTGDTPSHDLDSIEAFKKPLLFIHGYTGSDRYWGKSQGNLVDPNVDNIHNHWLGKTDYPYTSYPGRVNQKSNSFATWEYYYPGDQSWRDSGFLLSGDIKEITRRHNGQKVSIVAHSMGGLVTRSYVEETAEAYRAFGNSTGKVSFDNDIDRVLFLGTPHHGSFGGTRLYWGIYLPEFVQAFSGKDPQAPAARDLGIGSPYLLELNSKNKLNNNGVEYMQISGSTYKNLVPPLTDCNAAIVESTNHDDGIVALSSGNLVNFNIPVGFLPNFNHKQLNTPDAFGYTLNEVENKSKIPV